MDTESIYKGIGEVDLGEKVIQLQDKNSKLLQHVRKLEDDVERLCQEIIKMKKDKDALSKNISELFNTAKREIDRKNETITQLQEQLDDVYFRRNRASYNDLLQNNRFNEVKCDGKKSHSRSPQRTEKEKTKSKTPVTQRSRSSSSSKNCHKSNHSKRDYDKMRSPNRRRSRSRSPHRHKRRRSPSPGSHHGNRQNRNPFQRREYHSRGHNNREEYHSLSSVHRERIQNMQHFNHRIDNREKMVKSDQERSNQKVKEIERSNSTKKHYLVQEFENLYNEDIDTEADPSPFTDRIPFRRVPQEQNKNGDEEKTHSVLTEIYKRSQSLISEGIPTKIVKTLEKDCDTNENCLEAPERSKENSSSVNIEDAVTPSINTPECKIENAINSDVEVLKDSENKDCSTPMAALQATQQSIGRRRRRCVLKIKE